MRYVMLALLIAVDLGRGFQEPEIELVSDTSASITYDVSVEAAGLPDAVVVHFVDPGDDQVTKSLAPRGQGRYGGIVEVERANLVVVFESINAGESVLSIPTDLLELGVAPAILGITEVEPSPEENDRNWIWLVVAGGAALLSLLAFWALRDFRQPESKDPEPDDEAFSDVGAEAG